MGFQVDRQLQGTGDYDEPAERLALVAIRRPWELAQERVQAFRPERDLAGIDSPGIDLEDRFGVDMRAAVAGLERLMADSQDELLEDLADRERAARLNWLLGLAAVGVALLLAALLANRLSKTLVRPLDQLARAARSLAGGHLGHRVSINSTAELNEVGGTFNAMAEALEEQRAELERHAFTDALTGLPNRAGFEDRARHALDRAAGIAERVPCSPSTWTASS